MNNFLNYLDKRFGDYINVWCLHRYPKFLFNNISDLLRHVKYNIKKWHRFKDPTRKYEKHKIFITSDPEVWYDRLFVNAYLYDWSDSFYSIDGYTHCIRLESIDDKELICLCYSSKEALEIYKSIPLITSDSKLFELGFEYND